MNEFIRKYEGKVTGVLSGFDRLVFRGTLRPLAVASGMMDFLWRMGVLLKDFGSFVERKSAELKAASLLAAEREQRPVRYLASSTVSKEMVAQQIAEADGVDEGLICVLTCVEPCLTYEIRRDREKRELVLEPRHRKCLHLYHYWIDRTLGFMSGRIQTWFPFTIQICMNGREYLARQMDRLGMRYEQRENCFVRLGNAAKVQKLSDHLLRMSWPKTLQAAARRLNPAHRKMLLPYTVDYYWSVYQSEWATDVMFESARTLSAIYPALVRGGISAFGSKDVLRFLGKKPNPNFRGEVTSDYRCREEGVRLKHFVKKNSVKVYNKQGSVLRVETTINHAHDFKVFRPKEGDPDGPLSWRYMRKGIADLYRRAQVSHQSNERYLDALASLDTDLPLRDLVGPVCRPCRWKGHRVRGLEPWADEDRRLLHAVSRGEFAINGFRNRDLLAHLFSTEHCSSQERIRLSRQITRKLRLLRAHGVIRKVSHTHRYLLTRKGRHICTAIIQSQDVSLARLNKAAA